MTEGRGRMTRSWKRAIVAVLSPALVAVLVGAPIVSFGATRTPGDTQVTVFDPEGPFERDIDLGKPDFSPADLVFEIHKLLDPNDGTPIGHIYTRIQVMRVLKGGSDFVFFLDCHVKLAQGTILFNGAAKISDFETGAVFPVTGGTGAYELARGTVTGTFATVNGQDGGMLAFDLTTT
jgi:hypothetical protein